MKIRKIYEWMNFQKKETVETKRVPTAPEDFEKYLAAEVAKIKEREYGDMERSNRDTI